MTFFIFLLTFDLKAPVFFSIHKRLFEASLVDIIALWLQQQHTIILFLCTATRVYYSDARGDIFCSQKIK